MGPKVRLQNRISTEFCISNYVSCVLRVYRIQNRTSFELKKFCNRFSSTEFGPNSVDVFSSTESAQSATMANVAFNAARAKREAEVFAEHIFPNETLLFNAQDYETLLFNAQDDDQHDDVVVDVLEELISKSDDAIRVCVRSIFVQCNVAQQRYRHDSLFRDDSEDDDEPQPKIKKTRMLHLRFTTHAVTIYVVYQS
jgi:hypothetical protein